MINIHNMMEEVVLEHVNTLYDQVKAKGSSWLTCDCENCRLDTASYVLNRIPAKYVVSGRGVTHSSNFVKDNTQLYVDIQKLAVEGMHLVSSAKRPYHSESRPQQIESVNAFNFPTFFGNIFDGQTFEPVANAQVLLKMDGKLAEMMDVTWPNPCITYEATKGSYTFWVNSVEADGVGITKSYSFTIEVTAYGYQPTKYSFTVPLVSEKIDRREFNSTYNVKIQDIFMFKEGVENEQE